MRGVLPKPGTYVVAVSGGVDSVALLDYLSRQSDLELVVAHFDHGIRDYSEEDRIFVADLAKKYDLPFVYDEGRLGSGASEAAAREARYKFLNQVKQDHQADAIITAHHQDDVLETAIINLLRGTGRKGLTSLGSSSDVIRPLLNVTKEDLINYAKDQGLKWREDPTNLDQKYLRNYVRHTLLPKFDTASRQQLLNQIADLKTVNVEIDNLLSSHLEQAQQLERNWFNHLPHEVAREVMAEWLRRNGTANFDSKTIERLVVAAKVAKPGKTFPVQNGLIMEVKPRRLALLRLER